MVGLFAFFYGTLHFLIYVIADRFASLVDFPNGIVSWDTARRSGCVGRARTTSTSGRSSRSASRRWCLMVPLAVTSTAGWIRRLGGKRWNALHQLVYVSAVLGVDPLLVAGEGRHPRAAEMYAVVVGVAAGAPGLVGVEEAPGFCACADNGRAVVIRLVFLR